MAIGKKLREIRTRKGLKVSECAKELGISQSTYREWENGRSISGEPYLKIANLYSISISELFGLEKNELNKRLSDIEKSLKETLEQIKYTRTYL